MDLKDITLLTSIFIVYIINTTGNLIPQKLSFFTSNVSICREQPCYHSFRNNLMNDKKTTLLYSAHIIFPLLFGIGIYVHSTGNTYFTEALNFILPECLTSPPKWDINSSFLLRVLRFYFCDAVWAYSLTFSIAPFFGTSKIRVFFAAILCSFFCILLELIQMNPEFIGTFDFWDIIVEIITCFIAGIIFYTLFRRK